MSSENKWEQNIAKAMSEASQADEHGVLSRSWYIPSWLPYVVFLVFGFLLAKTFATGVDAHPVNEQRDYETGSKVTLLMVAEDIESYLSAYGELPDDVPSPIASVMDIDYQKLDGKHFRLRMPYGAGAITFDAREDRLVLE